MPAIPNTRTERRRSAVPTHGASSVVRLLGSRLCRRPYGCKGPQRGPVRQGVGEPPFGRQGRPNHAVLAVPAVTGRCVPAIPNTRTEPPRCGGSSRPFGLASGGGGPGGTPPGGEVIPPWGGDGRLLWEELAPWGRATATWGEEGPFQGPDGYLEGGRAASGGPDGYLGGGRAPSGPDGYLREEGPFGPDGYL